MLNPEVSVVSVEISHPATAAMLLQEAVSVETRHVEAAQTEVDGHKRPCWPSVAETASLQHSRRISSVRIFGCVKKIISSCHRGEGVNA